ncbi:nSTAND3 domain-containing NTPase [Thermolongibacillus altinsuensis]
MTKLIEIQNKIKSLGAGEFQKLADSYLFALGYKDLTSLGSVVGSNSTRKGTPDTYIRTDDDKYIFVEYTIQKDGLFEKINSDLDKCFDASVTNIEIEKIKEIIYCYTSQLYPGEMERLVQKCKEKNILLTLIGVDKLAQELYQNYPKLAKDFLGVAVDTGQIFNIEDFIKEYDKNSMSTPLGINFYFRENELNELLRAIDHHNALIVAGKPGVGKSKLVIEACKRYAKKYSSSKVWCIKSNGQNLYEDLKIYISEKGDYLIFIDDANQTTQLDIILEYLHEQDKGKNVKIIATVRDYALQKVVDKFQEHSAPYIMKIDVLNDEQIREMAKNEFNINNSLYLDRIEQIAQGNARLAVMACKIAIRENKLESITDTTQLMELYFKNVKKDLLDLEDGTIVKVAGLISFLNNINLNDSNNLELLCKIANIKEEEFIEAINKLHNMEIIDIYEDEVAKVSDQILSTYLFYLVFIDNKVLRYSELIDSYFPRLKRRIIENLNSLFIHFNNNKVEQVIKSEINSLLDVFKKNNDSRFEDLLLTFWFVRKTDTLIFIKEKIDSLHSDVTEPVNYDIKKNNIPSTPEYISTLLQYQSKEDFDTVLELLFQYLVNQPSDFAMIYSKLINELGFNKNSYYEKYFFQRSIIDKLIEKADNWSNKLFSMMFLRVAKHYLKFVFEPGEAKGRTYVLYRIPLISTEESNALRNTIWASLLEMFDIPQYYNDVLDILNNYGIDVYKDIDEKVVANDAQYIKLFIRQKLKKDGFLHCKIANHLYKMLEKYNIDLADIEISLFQQGTYKIYSLLKGENYLDEYDYNKEQELKRLNIENYIKDFTVEQYKSFFLSCKAFDNIESGYDEYKLGEGIWLVFSILANNTKIFPEVVECYLSLNIRLSLHPLNVIQKLIETIGFSDTEELISKYDYFNKSNWLYYFFASIPKEKVNYTYLEKIYKYFNENEEEIIGWNRDLEFLQNFIEIDPDIFVKVTKIMLKKQESEKFPVIRTLSSLFNRYISDPDILLQRYASDKKVLRDTYFLLLKLDRNLDYDGRFIKEFINKDDEFLSEFIKFIVHNKDHFHFYSNDLDFTFMWELDNAEELISLSVNYLEKELDGNSYLLENYVKKLFDVRSDNEEIKQKQDKWIKRFINENLDNDEKIELIFYTISHFDVDRRVNLVAFLLKINHSFDLFRKISLEPSIMSWSGSEVPVIERRISYYKKLLLLCNNIHLLNHRSYIENKILFLETEMKKVKIREFLDDYL